MLLVCYQHWLSTEGVNKRASLRDPTDSVSRAWEESDGVGCAEVGGFAGAHLGHGEI